jgi:hypothetical protein
MLPFLREQGFETAKQSDDETSKRPNAEQQEQEYIAVSAQSKNVRKTTYLLAVLFGIGLLCLWFMIKKSTPQTTGAAESTAETQIEAAITRLTGVKSEMFSGLDKIVKKFYEFSDVQQVQVNELVKNPFKHEIFLGNLKKNSDNEEGNLDIDEEMMRQQQLIQQTKHLQLLSIMQSDKSNCCMIDDEILYEGDSIRGFKVSQIGDSFVKLESEGTEILLKLSE